MKEMKVMPYSIRDLEITSEYPPVYCIPFETARRHPDLAKRWYHPVCSRYNPRDGLLYIGNTAYNNDILYTFDPINKAFTSLNFWTVANKFDVKVHRSLEIDNDGIIFGATACLHDLDQQHEAHGGKLFSYNPDKGEIEVLGAPVPPWYIQTITLDRKRRIIYGYVFQAPYLFRFDLDSRQTQILAYTSVDGHNLTIDDDGNLWAFWRQMYGASSTLDAAPNTTLLKYNPDREELTWCHNLGIPGRSSSDYVHPDYVLNGGDGFIYMGTTSGMLFRFDPIAMKFDYLGTPMLEDSRIGGMTIGTDGLLYIAAGRNYRCRLISYDRERSVFHNLGAISDPVTGSACCDTHFITETSPGLFYICETDNLKRSSYLWECDLR